MSCWQIWLELRVRVEITWPNILLNFVFNPLITYFNSGYSFFREDLMKSLQDQPNTSNLEWEWAPLASSKIIGNCLLSRILLSSDEIPLSKMVNKKKNYLTGGAYLGWRSQCSGLLVLLGNKDWRSMGSCLRYRFKLWYSIL